MRSAVPFWKSASVSAGLSLLFIVFYGGCNWITVHRADVGSIYFEWERFLPFVPLLIPAYMSLDLFFVGAPFLCRTGEELRVYSSRIAAAIVIAGLCFLFFPLKFAFPRPATDGILGATFDWFRTVDAPYNLLPSLHAALLLLVADVYVRHLRGGLRGAAIVWFILIGISPVLTYQHHLVDIFAGFGLAVFCFYLFPQQTTDRQAELRRLSRAGALLYNSEANRCANQNFQIGSYYLAGAALLIASSIVFRGWMWSLLWPATSLIIVGSAYFGIVRNVYRKANGRIPWSTRLVLAPCLTGQYVSLIYYRRKCRPWDAIAPRLWMGGRLSFSQADEAVRSGVTAVLDLTAELSEVESFHQPGPAVRAGLALPATSEYMNIPVLDLTAPNQDQLLAMSQFIEEHVSRGIVYVHCKIGFSRSAAAVAAYLIMTGHVSTAEQAFALIREKRPGVVIRAEVITALNQFESDRRARRIDEDTFVLAPTRPVLA